MKKRADIILFENKLVASRSKAQAMIMSGQVIINGKIVKKSGDVFDVNSNIQILDLNPNWVSRGATKLLHCIEKFNVNVDNMICLDIGASTGGFSEVLLKKNAKKIYSVDVGKNQLHEKLKKNKKIVSLEKTNAKFLDNKIIKDTIDLIVCDVSFISMKKVLLPCLSFLNKNQGIVIGLIKPQFEAKRSEVKRGGVVVDQLVHQRICDEFKDWFINNLEMRVEGVLQSPIKGPKGNKEFFIYANFIKKNAMHDLQV